MLKVLMEKLTKMLTKDDMQEQISNASRDVNSKKESERSHRD